VPSNLGPELVEDVRDGPLPPLDGFAMLPVWVESGYDGGRFAGWVPEVPGVLAVADTHIRAQTLAVTNTARVRGWLEAHGDDAAIPRIWRPELAGDVEAVIQDDGYEAKATLPTDRRPIDDEEVGTAIRRLGWAREDLLAMIGRLEAFERDHGPLPTNESRAERSVQEVLAHVAGTEVWLVGRLPRGGRYEGPLDDVPVRDALAGPRAWAAERLAALASTDDGEETADRHGETWTLAKVLRRIQAHGFDHLWELERRLVRADGTGDRIEIGLDRLPETAQVVGLLRSVGWDMRASEPASLEVALRATTEFATAWDGERLVGTARSITDGAQNALIATVVVDPAYQGLGLGERMIHLLTDGRDNVRFHLSTMPGLEPWYRKLGFIPDTHALFRPRRRG
jgi:hypothetical protein